jgi:hypothetical protein
LLTLVVVPSVYSLVEHGLEHLRDWTKQRRLAAPPEKSST